MKTFKELMQEKVQFEIPQHYEEDNNEFIAAASAAHRAGKKEFSLGGKTYPVTIKKPIKTEEQEPPFTPDKPRKNPVAKAGKYGQGYSVAKHLAQMAAKRQAEKQKTVKESDISFAAGKEKEKEKMLTPKDQNTLAKLRNMMDKEKENSMKFGKDVKEGKYVPDDVHINPNEKYAKEKAASHNAAVEKAKKMAAQRSVKEEVEELDELSKSTLASYAKKATADARFKQGLGKDYEALAKRKRDSGTKAALNRTGLKLRMKSKDRLDGVNKAIDRLAKEEVETIDELSKDALNKYKTKATAVARSAQANARYGDPDDIDSRIKSGQVYDKRVKGIKAADSRLKESYDETEYDYEGDMARGDLKSIMMNAKRVHDMLSPETNLPEWVQSKITKAEDYISTVANYMATEMMGESAKPYVSSTAPKLGEKGSHDVLDKDGKVVKSYPYSKEGMMAAQSHLKKLKEETIAEDVYSADMKPGKDGRMKPAHRIAFANSGTDKTKKELRKEREKEQEMEKEQFDLSDLSLEDLISLQEQAINEISKKTLGSYVSKASVDMANRTADATHKKTLAGADYAHNISRGMDTKVADKHMKQDYEDAKSDTKKAVKRMYGINKAVSRLTKEEAEQVEEKMNFATAKMGDVIKDFEKSDAPQFAGKSKEKRRQMAVAAKLGAEREAGMREDAEMPSFADFLREYEAKDGVYRHKGSYGSSYQGDSDDEDAPKKPSAPAVKRGRGRPVGSKSGARTAGSSTGKKSGVDYSGYPLHLPNKK